MISDFSELFRMDDPTTQFEDLLSNVPIIDSCKRNLRNELLKYGRFYHTIYHLALMWRIHKYYANKIPDFPFDSRQFTTKVACVIAYHDVKYDGTLKTNEIDSAKLWMHDSEVSNLGCTNTQEWVYNAIIATSDHLADRPKDELREWVLGLDLVSLAAPWYMFNMNNKMIRLEFNHLTDDEWKNGNGAFLKGLLCSKQIFHNPILYDEFEQLARHNLETFLG